MKRHPLLRPLSHDHHHGLLLGRNAKRVVAERQGFSEMWVEIERVYELELAPHFEIEERYLATALIAAGESRLTQRLLDDHARLAELLQSDQPRTSEKLTQFGELMLAHIRFEERELFPVAEKVLSTRQLMAISNACEHRYNSSLQGDANEKSP